VTIEAYLRELGRRLPSTRRTRLLNEAESHLRESADALVAAGVERREAERRAIEAFGPVDLVAGAFAEESARHATRRAAVITVGALALLVVPLYGIPENTLPPASWTLKPADIEWAQRLAVGLWLASLALGAAAVIAAVLDRARVARAALAGALAAGLASCLAAGYAAVRWLDEVPGSAASLLLGTTAALVLLGLAALGLAWARSKRALLPG
jgi:hypothetical protein